MEESQACRCIKYPFTLVLIRVYNDKGDLLYPDDPLWLIVMGKERQQLSLTDIYEAFYERGGMEHFFRFAKQNLLLDKFQTCETAHEEHWWQIVLSGLLTAVGGQGICQLVCPAPGKSICPR